MSSPVTPLYAPTAVVLQLNTDPVDPGDEYVFGHVEYTFTRRVRWTTMVNYYADTRFEIMPQQLLRIQELTVHRETWTPNDIDTLEAFVDAHKGSSYPFYITAPDSGESLVVRFRDDTLQYSIPDATVRTGDLVFVEVGDIDNSIDNGLIYPAYVESTTTSTSSTTTTTSTSSTSSTSTAGPVRSGTVSVSGGTNVTWISGDEFDPVMDGNTIVVNGVPTTVSSVDGTDEFLTVAPPLMDGGPFPYYSYV